MQKIVNKGRILGKLLKSPKTTAELARELGYVNNEGVARYNIINKDLKSLEESEYIKSERIKLKQRPGNIPTLYSIVPSFKNLANILEEYPYLVGNMQKSELALEIILSEHSNLFYISKKDEYVEQIEEIKLQIEKYQESLKEKLQLSTEFFKIFIMNDKNKLIHYIRKLVRVSGEEAHAKIFVINNNEANIVVLMDTMSGIDIAFKTCVNMDIMKGKPNRKAEEYVIKMRNEVQEEQIEQLKNYYKSTKIAPEFLRGKKLIFVENPKLKEIEDEFIHAGGEFVQY